MHINDTIKLARTKFRIRRIRLSIGIIILVLLFSAAITAFIMLNNIRNSVKGYTNSGVNGRYFIEAINKKPWGAIYAGNPPQELLDAADKYYKEGTAKEKAAYEKLGIEYVEDTSLYPYTKEKSENHEYILLNPVSPYLKPAITEYANQFHEYTQDDITRITDTYDPLNIYTSTNLSTTKGRTFNFTNGEEDFFSLNPNNHDYTDKPLEAYFDSFIIENDSLINAFLLEDFQLETSEIPIIVSFDIAERILELKALDYSNTDEERWKRNNYIRDQANAKPYEVCYRNAASISKITVALSANSDRHSKITYNMPTKSCDLPTVKTDNRSEAEKAAARQQEQQQTLIQKELGTYSEPHQQIIKYRIIGIMPDNDVSSSTPSDGFGLLGQLISSRFPSYLARLPKNLLENNLDMPEFTKLYSENNFGYEALWPKTSYIIEFQTPEDAQSFLANYNCEKDICDPDKPFELRLFGNNSVLIDQLFNNIANVLIGALLVIAIIAFLILLNIINRILTDSQKETAVFRAIGYRKSHITKIYLAYITIYSLIVYVLTILIVSVIPWIFNAIFSEKLGLYFTVFFDAKQYTPFNFASFEPLAFLLIIPIFLIGLISAIIPLIINSRRNIIKNLRQE